MSLWIQTNHCVYRRNVWVNKNYDSANGLELQTFLQHKTKTFVFLLKSEKIHSCIQFIKTFVFLLDSKKYRYWNSWAKCKDMCIPSEFRKNTGIAPVESDAKFLATEEIHCYIIFERSHSLLTVFFPIVDIPWFVVFITEGSNIVVVIVEVRRNGGRRHCLWFW